ncbi:hypothetical protein HYFRA_00006141 [Hymenoscyphus fraxineus]|uniref:Polyketide synthase n=1 Tax=Hymenoscyphus fraxineus TaxID=746836 RepID=A0A9N9LCB1_9HELO|nr:hypothetical protein HYFRA_00006141 [Hymenoscyphus fraxineus]
MGSDGVSSYSQQNARPVIIAFGGQVSTFVSLDPAVYQNVKVFRHHLNECDSARSPVLNALQLQPILFTIQYSWAKSWINCGVSHTAVIGHSFRELVAMCVSGAITLRDRIKMIIGRATAVIETWGEDGGSMIAIEANLKKSNSRCSEAGEISANIACFNSARNFTVSGSTTSIDILFLLLRNKRLNVTNAFHSTLVDPLVPKLDEIGQKLTFSNSSIHVEMSTESATRNRLGPSYITDRMRDPVYFHHAVHRLAQRYPSAIWIEAGSNSTITSMASRSLNGPKTSHFQADNITAENAMQNLLRTTIELWKLGLKLVHWSHHQSQTYDYEIYHLPPYQFEESRLWLGLKPVPNIMDQSVMQDVVVQKSFVSYKDIEKKSARFRINTMNPEYKELVSGHIIVNTAPICPATVEVNIAVEALLSIQPIDSVDKLQPRIESVTNEAPICDDPTQSLWLDIHIIGVNTWTWKISSDSPSKVMSILHVSGKITLSPKNDLIGPSEFFNFERLVGHQHCVEILNSVDAEHIIQRRSIYSTFGSVVDYAEPYRGVRRIVGKTYESAGRVLKKHAGKTWLDAHLADCFSQVGGIWVNCMTDCKPEDMYIAVCFERLIRSPNFSIDGNPSGIWDVLAKHHRKSEKDYVSDIMVFNTSTGALSEVILGINYHKVAKVSTSKMLIKLINMPVVGAKSVPSSKPTAEIFPNPQTALTKKLNSEGSEGDTTFTLINIHDKVKGLLAEISGLEPTETKDNTELADIGIDSLMGMELSRELSGMFKAEMSIEELSNVTDFRGLVAGVTGVLSIGAAISDDNSSNEGRETLSENSMSSLSSVAEDTDTHHKTLGDLQLSSSTIHDAFREVKNLTDQFIEDFHCTEYLQNVLPFQNELCVALVIEAFEKLGQTLALAKAGDVLPRINHAREHGRLTDYLYKMLEKEAHLVQLDGSQIART